MSENGKDERIGDYELQELIGDGAQGRVYKARYVGEDASKLAPGEVVALKLIRITGDDDKLRTKFQSQADILHRLQHTNIVSYRDSFAWHPGEWDEAQCMVMEYLAGEPLSERMKKASSGLPWSQVEEIFAQCLAALIHARERGITHRDIKPSNIFITGEGQAKIIDFDIARRDDSGQMSTAGWKGTFDYMAPDFITIPGFRGDEVSDIFSLGVCFYQALTGSLPYEPLGESAHIGYLNRWRDGAAPAPSFRPGAFRVLSNAKPFVAKCLTPKREQRYQSFAAMLEDFRKIRARRIRHKNKDEYELLSVLGRGGFGEVFKARRVSDGLLVAVKHLFAEKQSERFIKEAKLVQQYPHPNLCKYVDFIVVEGTAGEKQYFLILEFLEGMPGWTLRTRLKNEGRLEAAEAIPLYMSYLSALQFLHGNARPIIHRDIKPGNLYAPVGQPDKGKIFDLGVARDVSGTVTVGGVPGTLDYMPPEFAEAGGDRGSPQSDLYALGLCLYESLAGKPVYDRLPTDLNSAWVAFQQRLRKPLELSFESEPFRQYPRLKGVVMKSLSARPVDRYHSADDMRKELEDILAGKGGPAEEVAETTIATFQPLEDDSLPPEPGATMGTRPLDGGAGATMPAPAELLAAGHAEAERRRQQKRKTILIGAIAAAAVLLLGGAFWVVGSIASRRAATAAERMEQAMQAVEQAAGGLRVPVPTADYVKRLGVAYANAVKTGQGYPELGARIDEQRRQMRRAGAAVPAEFKRSFDAALDADKPEKAAGLLKEWQDLSGAIDLLGLTPQQFDERSAAMKATLTRLEIDRDLAALAQDIPAAINDEDAAGKAESSAARLKTLRDKAWPGFDETEKQQKLSTLAGTLSERAAPQIVRLRDAALTRYRAGQDGEAERDALLKFGESHPALAWVAESTYLDARNSVEAARQSRITTGGISRILDQTANAHDAAGVQAAVGELVSLEKIAGPRLAPAQVKSVEEAITAKYLFLAQALAAEAVKSYDAGQVAAGQKAQKGLADLIAIVPDRFGKAALGAVLQEAETRRVAVQAKQDQAVAARTRIFKEAAATLAEWRDRIRKGDLRECVDGATTIAGISADALSDKDIRVQRDAVVDDLTKLIEVTMVQKEPLDQRAARLKAADDLLNTAAAETVLGARVKVMRDVLAAEKAVFVVRFVNQSGQALTVSGQEMKEKQTLVPGGKKEIKLPVRSSNAPASFLIEGGAGLKPRIETVALAGFGGHDVLLTALDKEPPKESVAVPVVASNKPPAANTTNPVVVVAAPTPKKSVPVGKGMLDITVSPRSAVVTVDGNVVSAGSIDVTPDENHKVQVEAPSFKTCLQYYRVRAGECRKIDILLEKAPKKSLFGL